MKNKKYLSMLATMILAGSVIAGCSSDENTTSAEPPKQEEQVKDSKSAENPSKGSETEEKKSIEDSATVIQVNAYKSILDELSKAKEGQQVDWKKVSDQYSDQLQASVSDINGEFDQAIQAAIGAGTNGELDPNIARQLIDKSIQSYFYQKQKSLHSDIASAMEADDTATAELGFEELKHLINEVIIPTAVKRDGYYELTGEDSMEQNILAGLTAQEEALKAGNIDDFSVYKQITDKSSYRSYYLAANSYAEKIEKAVKEGNADETSLQIMQAEAWGFFQAIKGSLSGGNEEASAKLNELFSLNQTKAATIEADEVSDLFTKAFVGKITGYHKKAPEDIKAGNLTDGRAHALEGNVFMKDIELVMIEKLGEEKTATAFKNAEKWYEAISNEDLEAAKGYSDKVVGIVEQLVK